MSESLANCIKEKSHDLGFQKVGITKAVSISEEKEKLETWLSRGHHGTMSWLAERKHERGDIFTYFPDVKSVISLGMNYYTGYGQNELNSDNKFSNYAWGEDYHDILKSRLYKLLNWLKIEIPDLNGIACVDTSPVMDKVWAQRAGLGWQGKHTNLITKDFGSWLFLGELLVDIELDYDELFSEDLCGSCTSCIDSCPTQALGEYEIYAEKCISYLTIEHRGDFPDNRSELHNWIYGCDICQEVCPWNEKFSQVTVQNYFYPKKEILYWTNEDWERIDEEGFRELFKGSAVKRTKYSGLSRNINANR
ncbi:MAG: tRNA epoxyqueuosine(34) reductase QueG [Candidatus Marinimicrobia bacterium]|jgi:epoxyqueuosine reductase|nr:tRNA epoxyqueuosine(34) reductase QueG [Candidatus Neomarinimicrobiota bacterium]